MRYTLSHTSRSLLFGRWFRFPFYDVMKMYMSVLFKETEIVAGRHGGLQAALMTEGFFTDLVPGLVMSVIFAQLSALAQPCCLALGSTNNEACFVEELVAMAPHDFDWGAVDSAIQVVRRVGESLWVLRVPTFKPLTRVLSSLAGHACVELLLVSNHNEVQVKIVAQPAQAKQLEILKHESLSLGVKMLLEFSMPKVGSETPRLQAAFAVDVPALLHFLRACDKLNLKERQVYDFN